MLPNLKSLAVFAKVAEAGSFSGAANALGISAPVVSQHISQLEQTLDTALVYRSTRSLTLTDAGHKLSRYAHDMLDAAETGLEELQNVMTSPRGKLSVSMSSFMASPKFTALLADFMDAYPDVYLEVCYETGSHNLNESGYDLAIQLGDISDSNFMVRKLTEGHACLYASPDLIEKMGSVAEPEDFERLGYPFICETGWPQMVLHKMDDSDRVFERELGYKIWPQNKFWCNNGEAKKQMALLGRGVTWLPEMYVVNEVAAGTLVRILPEWTSERVSVYAVWPRNAGSRSLTCLFLEFMVEKFIKGMKREEDCCKDV